MGRSLAAVGLAFALAAVAARGQPEGAFAPEWVSVLSAREYWVLGRTCVPRGCFAVVRTSDGGRTLTRARAPLLPAEGTQPHLYAASARDAFIVVPYTSRAYATHDGGTTWKRLSLGTVSGVATTRRIAYAVTASCRESNCTRYVLRRSAIGADTWTSAATPFAPDNPILGLSARGSHVWLLGTRRGQRGRDQLARSADGGRTFDSRRGPCWAGTGGTLVPVSARVVWAVCPGGLLATALRSSDGGASFRPLRTRGLTNGAMIAPVSPDVALLAPGGAPGGLFRTSDAGRSWSRIAMPGRGKEVATIAFADGVGFAIVLTHEGAARELWRTGDIGGHWQRVGLR